MKGISDTTCCAVARSGESGEICPCRGCIAPRGGSWCIRGGSKIAVETGTAAVGGKAVMDGPAASLGISRKVGTMTGWKNG